MLPTRRLAPRVAIAQTTAWLDLVEIPDPKRSSTNHPIQTGGGVSVKPYIAKRYRPPKKRRARPDRRLKTPNMVRRTGFNTLIQRMSFATGRKSVSRPLDWGAPTVCLASD